MNREELLNLCKEWSDESSNRHILVIAVETHDENDDTSILTSCNALRMAANMLGSIRSDNPPKGLQSILKFYNSLERTIPEGETPNDKKEKVEDKKIVS